MRTLLRVNYEFPPVTLLSPGETKVKGSKKAVADTAAKLQRTLYTFGVSAKVENVSVGPAITRYELKLAEGVRVSKIAKLSDDISEILLKPKNLWIINPNLPLRLEKM